MRSLLPFVLLGAGAALAADRPGHRVDELAWLAGAWCSETETATAEEYWTPPGGGILLGIHRDTRKGGKAFFEYLRIVQEDGTVVYYASPGGGPATPFALVELGGTKAVFANPEHDYPQRIIYQRRGDELTATIEGEIGGETRSSAWRWKRDDCGFLDAGEPGGKGAGKP